MRRRWLVAAALALAALIVALGSLRWNEPPASSSATATPRGSSPLAHEPGSDAERGAVPPMRADSSAPAVVRELESGAPSGAGRADTAATDALHNVRLRVKTVRRSDGVPVASVVIISVVFEGGRRSSVPFVTDDAGAAEIDVVRDAGVTLRVEPPGDAYEPTQADLEPMPADAAEELVIPLERERRPRTWVRVVARADGRPIAAAQIGVRRRGPAPATFDLIDDATSDVAGLTEVSMFTQPVQEIEVAAAGYAKALAIVRIGAHDRRDHPLVVALERAAHVVGTLVDAEGRPLPDVSIVATVDVDAVRQGSSIGTPMQASEPHRLLRVDTADDGSFELDHLPANVALRLTAELRRYVEGPMLELTLAPGETRRVDWRLAATVTVRGRVVGPDGTPSRDAIVRMRRTAQPQEGPRPAIVEDDGTFAIDDVRAGDWSVSAVDRDRQLAAALRLTIEAETAPRFLEIALAPQVRLHGRVQYADGSPVSGIRVRFDSADAAQPVRFASTEDGDEFEFEGLTQGGGRLVVNGVVVELPSIPETEVIVELPAPARGAAIAGRVLDGGVGIQSEARITARRRGGGEEASTYTTSQRLRRTDGRPIFSHDPFEFVSLPPGTWDLVAVMPDGRVGVALGIELRADEARAGVAIDLAAGAWATIRVLGLVGSRAADTVAPPTFQLQARLGDVVVAREPLARDLFTDLLVPAGRITFELWSEEPRKLLASSDRNVAAGDLLDVELRADR